MILPGGLEGRGGSIVIGPSGALIVTVFLNKHSWNYGDVFQQWLNGGGETIRRLSRLEYLGIHL